MKVDFIYFDAGGGHRAAANALRQVMEQQKRPFEIRMVNLQEVLDAMDVFRKVTGLRLQDVYNLMLKKGWTLGSPQLMVGMHRVIRLFHSQDGAAAGRVLARAPSGHGGLAGAEFRPRAGREPGARRCRAFRWSPSSRISPTIRRTSGSRTRSSISSAAPPKAVEQARAHGACRRTSASRFGHDSESAVLRDCAAFGGGAGGGARRAWASIRRSPSGWCCSAERARP